MITESKAGSGRKNFAVFRAMRAELLQAHPEQFALFHGGEFVGVFPTRHKANRYADKHFPDDACLLEELTDRPVVIPWIHTVPKPDNSEGSAGAEG